MTSSTNWLAGRRTSYRSTLRTFAENWRVAEPPVVNASPLIVLAKAGLLDLLKLAGERVLVPEVVADEVRAYRDDAGSRALESAGYRASRNSRR